MARSKLILAVCLFWSTYNVAQTTIQGQFKLSCFDNVGNILTVENNELIKLKPNGETYQRWSNKLAGNIDAIDATNALKLILFNSNLSQVQVLDNKLGERGTQIALDQIGLEQVTAVAYSYNNGLWLFDALNFELIRLDQNLQPSTNSGNLINITGHTVKFIQLIEAGKWLYALDEDLGIFVFDVFGTFTNRIPIAGAKRLRVENDDIFYLLNDVVFTYNRLTLENKILYPAEASIFDFDVFKSQLLLQQKDSLKIVDILSK